MALWLFLVTSLLALSSSTAKTSPEQDYVLMVPAILQGNFTNEACVHLLNLNESVSMNVTLEYNTETYSLWDGIARTSHFSRCFRFMAPSPSSNPIGFIALSCKGASINIYKRSAVAIRIISTTIFIQTDKPIYKPGQIMRFRVVTLDSDFMLLKKTYPSIHIQDPQNNRIAQWLNQSSPSGIIELELEIYRDTNLGSYQITAQDNDKPGSSASHWYSVEEYVIPKFEVTINAPPWVSPYAETFKAGVCARYTYGQPVQGAVQVRVCRNRFYNPRCDRDSNGICEVIHTQLDDNGCVSETISTKAFHLYASPEGRHIFSSLNLEMIVTENGTGVQATENSYISVYQARKNVIFEDIDWHYKRGIPLTGKMKLTDENNKPMPGKILFLELNDELVANYTTDKDGIARFSIDTSELYQSKYKLRAYYQSDQCTDYDWLDTYQPEATHNIQRFFSRSNSFVKIEPVSEELPCGQQRRITVHYIIGKEHYKNMQTTQIHFHYILIAQGKIVNGNTQLVRTRPGHHGTFSITINVNEKMAPRARLLVYSLQPRCDLMADSIFIQVEKCFRNKVSLQFSEKKVLPGSNAGLILEASNSSLCALSGVDKSVLLLRPGTRFSPDYVFSHMPYSDLWGYYYQGTNLQDDPKEPCIELQDTFYNGLYYVPVNVTDDGSVYDVLENLGIKAFTKCTLRKPVVCQSGYECKKISSDYTPYPPPPAEKAFASDAVGGGVIESKRTNFAETWLWNLVTVDSSGKSRLSYTAPDTITEWEVSAFCVQDRDGFGMSKPAYLTVFQPFFVDPRLPYSIIRGEEAQLIVIIFNYQNSCIEVTVTLEESADFTAEKLSPENSVTRLCANETVTHIWRIDPKKLGTVNFTITAEAKAGELTEGRRDIVVQSLLVEPEGVRKEVTQSSLMCVKGTTGSEQLTLALPENLVKDSARAYFTVLGDIMGSAMKLSENFLQVPNGCGEQIIGTFLSNLVIFHYLKNTKQLTEEKKSKIEHHLTVGYQKQLAFRRYDGSFSTFGSRNTAGSLLLTATVHKAFGQSKDDVFVDENVISQALIWIASKQEADGCFKADGTIYNNAVKEGEDYGVIMTGFVTSSLLEGGLSQSMPVVKKALACLDAVSDGASENRFETALLAYTYSLAGRPEKLKPLLDTLLKTATKVGGHIYWEREKKPRAEYNPSFYPRAASAEIQMTSYALMAYLNQRNLSQENIVIASQIARWIVKQQNSVGGFSSTQDTPVALKALAQFGELTFVNNAQNTIAISDAEGSFEKKFQVDDSNTILVQQTPLPNAKGNYSVQVNGSGCVYTQVTLIYNVNLPTQSSGFALAVNTRNASCDGKIPPRFNVEMTASYIGQRNSSNMAIMDMKLPTGYGPDPYSLQQLPESDKVMRVEQRNDHLFIYMEELSSKKTTLSLTLVETHKVLNIKPSDVKLYDYYETDESAQAQYNTPCQQA